MFLGPKQIKYHRQAYPYLVRRPAVTPSTWPRRSWLCCAPRPRRRWKLARHSAASNCSWHFLWYSRFVAASTIGTTVRNVNNLLSGELELWLAGEAPIWKRNLKAAWCGAVIASGSSPAQGFGCFMEAIEGPHAQKVRRHLNFWRVGMAVKLQPFMPRWGCCGCRQGGPLEARLGEKSSRQRQPVDTTHYLLPERLRACIW
jgi:hypothetical protein